MGTNVHGSKTNLGYAYFCIYTVLESGRADKSAKFVVKMHKSWERSDHRICKADEYNLLDVYKYT
jgi:hypothetical protein